MMDFALIRARVGGLKGVITRLGDSPPEHKWKTFPQCPFCGHKDSAGVFERDNAEFFKCHYNDCTTGGRCVTEVGYINLRLGLSEDKPAAGGPSPAYKYLLELANAYVEPPKRVEPNPAEPVPSAPPPLANPVLPPAAPVPEPAAGPAISLDEVESIRQAIEVIRHGNASVESLKRQLRVGHARAVQIMEQLERRGVVGRPIEGQKFRVILNLPPPGAPPPPENVLGVLEPGSGKLGGVTGPTSPLAGSTFINGGTISAPPESGGPVPPVLPQNPPLAPPIAAVPEKSVVKREEKPELVPGMEAMRWFYARLSPTSSQMKAYLPDDAPVPDPLPDELLQKLKFRPVGLDEKRMLLPESCEALGFRANPRTNELLLQEMRALFDWEELLASGLWREANRKRQQPRRPNSQFCGKGQVGKKPAALRRDEEDKWQWGWSEPVLIPYFNEAGELVKLRPHKGGAPAETAAGSERIYVPRDYRTVADQEERFSNVIICEGEFKAAVIWQSVGAGAGLHGYRQPPVGVCALPGISFARNLNYRADLEEWLRQVECQKVLVAFDDEDKSHKPMRQRFDSEIFARYLAESLSLALRIPARFIKLPEEWRVNGKADWDGGLVKLRDEKRARVAAGGG